MFGSFFILHISEQSVLLSGWSLFFLSMTWDQKHALNSIVILNSLDKRNDQTKSKTKRIYDNRTSVVCIYLLWFELLLWTLSRSQSVSSLLLLWILLVIELFRWLMMLLNDDSSKNPEPPDDAVQSGSLDILLGSLRVFDVTIRDDRRTAGLSIFVECNADQWSSVYRSMNTDFALMFGCRLYWRALAYDLVSQPGCVFVYLFISHSCRSYIGWMLVAAIISGTGSFYFVIYRWNLCNRRG